MPYQVSPTDPIVTFNVDAFERAAAARMKTAGITTQAQLNTVIANLTVGNNPGMSAAACASLQVLLSALSLSP